MIASPSFITNATAASGRSHGRAALGVALAAASLLAWTASPARAQQIVRVGDSSNLVSGFGVSAGVVPPGGGEEELITTENSDPAHDGSNVSGHDAVPVATLANFLYLGTGDVQYNAGNPGTEGSGIEFTLKTTGPTVVSFYSNFVTSEDAGHSGANPDFSLYTITPVNGGGTATGPTMFTGLGSAGDAAGNFSAINDPNGTSPFDLQEGYRKTTFTLTTPGSYVIGFGVADANTYQVQSGLFVADINITSVPEPGVTTLLLLAGGGMAWAAVRRRRAQAAA